MVLTNTQKLKALEKYLGPHAGDEHEVVFRCPVCKDPRKEKKKLCVRIDDGTFHCWVCDTKGRNFWQLFKKLVPEALKDPQCIPLFEGQRPQHTEIQSEPQPEEVNLPKELFLVGLNEIRDPDISSVRQYLLGRGLTTGDMLRWRISATKSGSLRRKAIIPSFDTLGEPNYFVSRSIDETPYKYKNCKRQKTEIVFNEIDIDWSQPVVLVEGVFDAIKSPENTIPILGSSLPKNSLLFRRLWEHGCKVTVALDPDLKMKSHRICEDLSRAGLEVWQVWAPDGRDFGSMEKNEVKEILENAKPWLQEDRLFLKIRNIGSGSFF